MTKKRYLKNKDIDENEKPEYVSKHDNERKYSRRRTSGYVPFNTEKDKTRSENVTSSEEENDLFDMQSHRSGVQLKYSHDKNNEPKKSLSQKDREDEESESECTESDWERHSVHTSSHHKSSSTETGKRTRCYQVESF